MTKLRFPLLAMWLHPVGKMNKGEHMSQLVQQGAQKTIRVQICIDADTVIRHIWHRMTIIAQYTPALMRKRKVYGIRLEKGSDLLKCTGW